MHNLISLEELSSFSDWFKSTVEYYSSMLDPLIQMTESIKKAITNFNTVKSNIDGIVQSFSFINPFNSDGESSYLDNNYQEITFNTTDEINKTSEIKFVYDAFLSHSWSDNTMTDKLKENLKRYELKVFYDRDSIKWGDDFEIDIYNALKCSRTGIFFITKKFMKSENACMELKYFFDLNQNNYIGRIYIILCNVRQEDFNKKFPFAKSIQSIKYDKNIENIAWEFESTYIDHFENKVEG